MHDGGDLNWDPESGDPETDSRDEDSWQLYAAGAFAEVVPADSFEAVDADDWHSRSPIHHMADMFVHRYGTIAGRASLAEFWWGCLAFVVVTTAFALSLQIHPTFKLVFIGWLLLGSVALASGAVRRLHDTDRSGALLLLLLLPGPGFYLIYVLSGGGDPGPNSYGDHRVKYVGPLGKKVYWR